MGTSATFRLIEGVRLIRYLLNTGFTASQTQGLLTGLPVASPVYKTHSFSSLGGGGINFVGSRSGGASSGSPNFDTISEKYL